MSCQVDGGDHEGRIVGKKPGLHVTSLGGFLVRASQEASQAIRIFEEGWSKDLPKLTDDLARPWKAMISYEDEILDPIAPDANRLDVGGAVSANTEVGQGWITIEHGGSRYRVHEVRRGVVRKRAQNRRYTVYDIDSVTDVEEQNVFLRDDEADRREQEVIPNDFLKIPPHHASYLGELVNQAVSDVRPMEPGRDDALRQLFLENLDEHGGCKLRADFAVFPVGATVAHDRDRRS